MKISIVTATFNSATTVRDTLESVFGQTYHDWEVIIKDGGSKDDTLDICRGYESRAGGRIRIISCADNGLYDAMNQGIEAASGDVVGILNSDDMYYDSGVLATIAGAFEDVNVDAVCGDLKFVDAEDTDKVIRVWKGSPYRPFSKGWHPAHPTFYARKELFDRYGAFDITFAVSADFELMLRFIEKNGTRVKYLPCMMVKMRQGGESTGSLKNIIKGNRNIIKAFKKNGLSAPLFYTIRRLVPKALNVIMTRLGRKSSVDR